MANRENAFIEITTDVLLKAYACGIFPMAESADDPALYWIEPDMRGIIPLEGFHVPARLARTVRSTPWTVHVDRDFDAVIEGCAEPKQDRARTWINARIRRIYRALFERGHCHTVEVYDGNELVGGLYGVSLGRAFFGESMFHRARDASKIALVHLVARLTSRRLSPARHAIRNRASANLRRRRSSEAALSPNAGGSAHRRSRFRRPADRSGPERRESAEHYSRQRLASRDASKPSPQEREWKEARRLLRRRRALCGRRRRWWRRRSTLRRWRGAASPLLLWLPFVAAAAVAVVAAVAARPVSPRVRRRQLAPARLCSR